MIIKKLGVVICLIALIGSLFLGVLTNTSTSTDITTEYNYVADMSQTFTYQDMPDYTQYNPTKNYSGYVASDGQSSGIKYTTSTGASNYRVMESITHHSLTVETDDILTNDTSIVPPKRVSDGGITGPNGYAVAVEKVLSMNGTQQKYYYFALRDGSKMGVAHLRDALSQIITYIPSTATTITIDFASHDDVYWYDYSAFEYMDSNLVYYAPYQWDDVSGNGISYWPKYLTPQVMDDYTPGDSANVQYPIKYDRRTTTYYLVTDSGDVAFDPSSYVLYWSLIDGGTGEPNEPWHLDFSGTGTDQIKRPYFSYTGDWTSNVYIEYDEIVYGSMKINDGVRISNLDPSITTDWTNDVDNGIIDIVFGTNNTVLMENTFTINYKDGTTQELTVSRADNGPVILTKGADDYTVGTWDHFLLRIDAINGNVSVYPVTSFTNYTRFTVSNTPVQLGTSTEIAIPTGVITSISYDPVTTDPNIDGDGLTSFTFSVTDTTIYLTNKLLMVNPSIDINNYFTNADADGWRLNFYSFATIGTSMTINGNTYPVSDGKITVGGRTLKLTNIYVSYDKLDDHIYFTWANDRVTVDLGERTTSVISMTGAWFFNTGYYTSETTTTTSTEIQWTKIPPFGTVALFFIGITAILMAIGIKKFGFELPDYIITITALAVAFCVLEAFI